MFNKEISVIRIMAVFFTVMLLLQACKKDDDTTPPGQVTNLEAVPGNGKVDLSWTEPADADLKNIEISIYPGAFLPVYVPAGFNSVELSGLTNGTEYTFSLRSMDKSNNKSDSVTISAIPNTPLVITSPDQSNYNPAGPPTYSVNGQNQLQIAVTFNRSVRPPSFVPGKTIYIQAYSSIFSGTVEMSNGNKTATFTSTETTTTICEAGTGDCLFSFHVIGTDTGDGTVEDTNGMVLDGDEDGEPGGDYVLNLIIVR